MIWRRLQIDGNTSIADLHYIIQIAMGWNDDYLHHFHIHGMDYGISRAGVRRLLVVAATRQLRS